MRMSHGERITGKIKSSAKDFVVEEITGNGTALEVGKDYSAAELGMQTEQGGKFSLFIMQKENWNTAQALKALAKKLGRGFRSAGFAGTKDRISVSTQLCSLFGVSAEQLRDAHIKDIRINGAWQGKAQVRMGELLGNRFTVRIKTEDWNALEKFKHIDAELGGLFPNYFGLQRFGARDNNVKIGLHILRGEFEEAAMAFVADSENEENSEAVVARGRLREERDFKAALSYFPKYLRYERQVLEYLALYPTDFANAIRKLPRQLSLMFVHSVESHIFNAELEERLRSGAPGEAICGTDANGFPKLGSVPGEGCAAFEVANIVGYDTAELTAFEERMLEDLGLSKGDFKVKRMPELNCRGSYRVLLSPYLGMEASQEGGALSARFSLPAGAYATSLLEEFAMQEEVEEQEEIPSG